MSAPLFSRNLKNLFFFRKGFTGNKSLVVFYISLIIVIFSYPSRAQFLIAPFSISDSAVNHLSKAIQIKTISNDGGARIDSAVFIDFRLFLQKSYPLVHEKMQRTIINNFSYIFTWKGLNEKLDPYVLMGHQDVVPVEKDTERDWYSAPFGGRIINDTIWGRGAIDDKGCMIAILEAAEQLLISGCQPERTIYFCFGHDEETAGMNGAKKMAEWFLQNKIRPSLVLDEGLEVIEKNYPDLKRPIALIGVGEKGFISFELLVEKPGGHSSAPQKETAIDILNNALVNIHNNPMPAHLIKPTREFLDQVKYILPPKVKMAINNKWLLKRALLRKLGENQGTNAIIRTTIVPTVLNSGTKENVVPSVAKAIINCRILPGESINEVEEFIRKQVADDRIQIRRIGTGWNPSSLTSSSSYAYEKVESLVSQLMPHAMAAPMIVIGASDSRYFRPFSDGVINFVPSIDSKGEHGINEFQTVENFQRMIQFYSLLMQQNDH